MTNGYREFEVEKSFASGMAVQRIISHLQNNGAGDVVWPVVKDDRVVFSVCTYNPLVTRWIEDELAPFV